MKEEKINIKEVANKIYEISEQKEDNKKIEDIIYYEEYEFLKQDKKHFSFSEKDVFMIKKAEKIEGKDVITYELYNKEGKLLASSDKEGNIEFSEEYKSDLKKIPKEYYSKIGFDERKMKIEDIVKEPSIKKEILKEKKESEIEEKKEKDKTDEEKMQKMERDLSIKEKDIQSSSEIRDKEFYKLVPEAKNFKDHVSIVYIGSTNEFKILGVDQKTGKYKELKTVLASQAVEQKSSIDLGREGDNVKRETLKAVLKIKGEEEYSFSAKLEPYSPIKFKELRRDLHTGEYISTDMQTYHQYPTTKEVDKMMRKEENYDVRQEVEEFEKIEKKGKTKTDINQIKDETTKKKKEKKKEKEDNIGKEKTIHDRGNKYYY